LSLCEANGAKMTAYLLAHVLQTGYGRADELHGLVLEFAL